MRWLSLDAPSGWAAVVSRAVLTAVVVFVVLQAKELFEAGVFDTPTNLLDGILVGLGMFAVNGLFVLTKPPTVR